MGILFACSGACCSGKSTAIKAIAATNPNVTILHELIRDEVDDIDAIRRTPSKYLDLQLKVIHKKISQEDSAMKRPGITIADRSLVDSLFYYLTYVDKAALTPDELGRYFHLLEELLRIIIHRYDHIFLFEPISVKTTTEGRGDPLRPAHMEAAQHTEFMVIRALIFGLKPGQISVCNFTNAGYKIQQQIDLYRAPS